MYYSIVSGLGEPVAIFIDLVKTMENNKKVLQFFSCFIFSSLSSSVVFKNEKNEFVAETNLSINSAGLFVKYKNQITLINFEQTLEYFEEFLW